MGEDLRPDGGSGAADWELNNVIQGVVDDISLEEGWQEARFEMAVGTKAGDNYIGVVQRIIISGKRDGQEVTKSLICKTEPKSEAVRERFRTGSFFKTEAAFYNEILPAFQNFQTQRGLPQDQHFSSLPTRCYHASNILILEDMTPAGFIMKDRREPLDVEHCRMVVRVLGHFHAISFAMQDQNPEEFFHLTSLLQENMFVPAEKQTLLTQFEKVANDAVNNFVSRSKLPNITQHERLVKDFAQKYILNMIDLVRGEKAEPFAVIGHGDCWTNNFLFTYDEENPIPTQMCLLDYQLARYASPITDLAYVLFVCTEKKMRDKHYDQLMTEYHCSLSHYLKLLGSDPEKLFPYTALQDQLQTFGKFGLGMAFMMLPLFTCDPKNAPTTDEEDTVMDMTGKTSELCWTRMNEIIEDMVERNYLGST